MVMPLRVYWLLCSACAETLQRPCCFHAEHPFRPHWPVRPAADGARLPPLPGLCQLAAGADSLIRGGHWRAVDAQQRPQFLPYRSCDWRIPPLPGGRDFLNQVDQDSRSGLIAAVGAYGLWGLLPIFFKLLHHVSPGEVVAQRIIWSLILILALLVLRRNLSALVATLRAPHLLLPLLASALLIALNWLIYVWAVNDDHVIAASLGYFLNPLVNVALGVFVLKERLRRVQAIAIGIAAVGVAIMAGAALTTLWISIGLALSFAFYGLVRKLTPVSPMAGLGAETLILTVPATAYLMWLSGQGGIAFGGDSGTTALLILSGAITTIPLVLFAIAARRLPMTTLGLIQYIAPTLQFLCGILLFGESLSGGQIASFILIWLGLILFATDSVRAARQSRLAAI